LATTLTSLAKYYTAIQSAGQAEGGGWLSRHSGLRRWIRFFYFLQELFDALNLFLRKIKSEMQFGDAPKLQAFDQFASNVAGGMLQSFHGVGLFCDGTLHTDKNARMLHVLLHANFIDNHISFEPWILQLADKHRVDLVSDFFAHTQVTMIRWTHGRSYELEQSLADYLSDAPETAKFGSRKEQFEY